MRIPFYDHPSMGLLPPEEVRFKEIGIFVHEDGRRVAVGFEITPFQRPPSIEVMAIDSEGLEAASLSVIDALRSSFHLTMHLQNHKPCTNYRLETILYYREENGIRNIIDHRNKTFTTSQVGEQ
jgi:hypothetical protein